MGYSDLIVVFVFGGILETDGSRHADFGVVVDWGHYFLGFVGLGGVV